MGLLKPGGEEVWEGHVNVVSVVNLFRPCDFSAHVFLQSDLESTAVHMRRMFEIWGGHAFRPDMLHEGSSSGQGSELGQAWVYTGGASPRAELAASTDAAQGPQGQQSGEESAASSALDGNSLWAASGWLAHNPLGAPTEREVYMSQITGGRVFRLYLERV